MDRIQAIRVFLRVVDLGSFSKAAADLRMGQPSATKMVAQLEKRVGARLLHRTTHGVTPTEVGALYYEKCKLIAHHVDEAESVAALLQSELKGELRLTTSVSFGRRVFTPMVMRFMKLHPGLRVDLVYEDRYVNLVEQGIDVAVRMGRLGDSTLGSRFLATNPWVLVAAPAYLKRRGTPRAPADLAGHDALVYSTVQGDARWQFTGPDGRKDTVLVHGLLRANNLSALQDAACAGMGVAALPWYVAYDSVSAGQLKPLLARWSLPSQDIHAVFPSPRLVPAKVSRFVDWLRGQFGPTWWAEPR